MRRRSSSSVPRPDWIPPGSRIHEKGLNSIGNAASSMGKIKLRITHFENTRNTLRPDERWPTAKAVNEYKMRVEPSDKPLITAESANLNETASRISSSAGNSYNFPFSVKKPGELSTFPQFSALPAELRLQVWEHAACLPKFIQVGYLSITFPYTIKYIKWRNHDSLSMVCRESREVAAKAKLLATTLRSNSTISRHASHGIHSGNMRQVHGAKMRGEPLVFNHERDTIFFRPIDNLPESVAWGDFVGLNTVQHIALPLNMLDNTALKPGNWHHLLFNFTALKTVTFVLGCKEKSWTQSQGVDLRSRDEWFQDGREGGKKLWEWEENDLEAAERHPMEVVRSWRYGPTARRSLTVRVVAWKTVRCSGGS